MTFKTGTEKMGNERSKAVRKDNADSLEMTTVARSTEESAMESVRKTDRGSDGNADLHESWKKSKQSDEDEEDFENVAYLQVRSTKRRKAITYEGLQDSLYMYMSRL